MANNDILKFSYLGFSVTVVGVSELLLIKYPWAIKKGGHVEVFKKGNIRCSSHMLVCNKYCSSGRAWYFYIKSRIVLYRKLPEWGSYCSILIMHTNQLQWWVSKLGQLGGNTARPLKFGQNISLIASIKCMCKHTKHHWFKPSPTSHFNYLGSFVLSDQLNLWLNYFFNNS